MKGNIIAFSGSHGTSKSTSAYNLASYLKMDGINVVVIDELARECPFLINKDANELTQYWILVSQMKREMEMMEKYDYIISDRAIFDTLAYGVSLNLIERNCLNILSKYVALYYREILVLDPIGFNFHIPDGIRDMDGGFRLRIHNTLLDLYNLYNIEYTLLKSQNELKEYIINYKWK